jgi:hypothetical protein
VIPHSVVEITGFNFRRNLKEVWFGQQSRLKTISGFIETAIECVDLPESVEILQMRAFQPMNQRHCTLRIKVNAQLREFAPTYNGR